MQEKFERALLSCRLNMELLSAYVKRLTRLKRGNASGVKAPHKPILLLAVMEGLEKKEIGSNKIRISAELVAGFKGYWSQLIKNDHFTENFSCLSFI